MAGCSASLPETHIRTDIYCIHIDPLIIINVFTTFTLPSIFTHTLNILFITPASSTLSASPESLPLAQHLFTTPNLHLLQDHPHHHGYHHPQGSIPRAVMCFCMQPPLVHQHSLARREAAQDLMSWFRGSAPQPHNT